MSNLVLEQGESVRSQKSSKDSYVRTACQSQQKYASASVSTLGPRSTRCQPSQFPSRLGARSFDAKGHQRIHDNNFH